MKKILLIFLCFCLFTGCSTAVKTSTLVGLDINKTEVETLPVTADLAISEQKARGEANGKVTELNSLIQEAKAKALGQDVPSVDKPDVLIGSNAFTETSGADLKVIVTGYPAYYTNFRTATKEDSLRLNIVDASPIIRGGEGKSKGNSKWYFSVKYHFGEGFGLGTGFGVETASGFLLGLEADQGGFIEDDDKKYKGAGGGLTVGKIHDGLPNDLQLVYGSSIGFWIKEREIPYMTTWGPDYRYEDESHVLAPFVKLRWHSFEAGLRMFMIPNSDLYLTIGYTF